MREDLAVVAGGGGFIGGHLVAHLRAQGQRVRAVDRKPLHQWCQLHPQAENVVADLADPAAAASATKGATIVYQFAADMGGMGFIDQNKALCMLSVLANTHMLVAARDASVHRFFFASSACVYNVAKQGVANAKPLREADAYPAMPEDGYGWEKLFSERMCRHFHEDFGLSTRIARYHNVYGPHGEWQGGREKAPAALCRKVIHAMANGASHIDIWGHGSQTRSFMYIDDCIRGTMLIAQGASPDPVNLGSDELVTVDQLTDVIEEIAGVTLERRYDLSAPKGVEGRNSDNSLLRQRYGWAPSTRLRDGMEATFRSIYDAYVKVHGPVRSARVVTNA